ncbi:hypothetical protein N7466_001634 [Penicillium verhagenii]|uniref:uncharacterized protein n=1 Tax=Penicillium verhagenii TaxID=1562060 RepID=UPI002544DD91|nr:uncharacterized protein N7466_001634 [Penicillium verhagenii]KAJ5938500.1 hypothetical protein N7466_001634 [Penicillium verhagenii]
MLSELPTELLLGICESLQRKNILALRLVCQRFYSLFTDVLFRRIVCDEVPLLFRAVEAQRLDIVALLIEEYHVDIDYLHAGKNALLLAIDLRYPQAVDLILQYRPDVRYCCDFGGRGPLSLAVIGGNAASVERILQSQEIDVNDRCSDGLSALVYALKHREYYALQILLADPRVDVNLADSLGWTPLQAVVLEGDHIAAQMLVRHAAIDINHQTSHNDAPLLLAVKRLNRERSALVVESLLLHSNLDVNISDSNGQTALWHAVNRGQYDLVKLLLRQSHLRLNDPDRYGVTPLARAAERPVLSVLELLLEQRQICINSQSTQIVPPLWSACRAGNSPAVEALLRLRSVQANQKSPTGTTPLQVAVHLNHLSIVSLLLRQRKMVDINARGHQQWTAIFFAASNGYISGVKTLLEHPGINLNLIDDQGRTPLWWAEHGQHSSVVDLLRKHIRSRKRKCRLARGVFN